jgi:hypothetical protein
MLFRRFSAISMACAAAAVLGGCMLNPAGVSDPAPEGKVVGEARPPSPTEQVLMQMSDLPVGEALSLPDGLSATAYAPYFAASGRQCRQVALRGGEAGRGESRLACSSTGETWVWYPSVLP